MVREKRKYIIVGCLSLLLTFMQIYGWQVSMKYGTSVYQSSIAQKIGILGSWQCFFIGIAEFIFWCVVFYFFFGFCEEKCSSAKEINIIERALPKYTWLFLFCFLYGIYLVCLIGCYPGFYNYDMGNQLPQIMYPEVPFNAHHPLFHTIVGGGIITIGYKLSSTDLTFGIFLYCAIQMAVCAASFTYSMRFIYERTERKIIMGFAFLFYAFCPPIVMFAMSTTKDVTCYAALLMAVLKLYNIYQKIDNKQENKIGDWIMAGIFLTLSCLLRNNIIYAVVVFAIFSICFIQYYRKRQILFFLAVIFASFIINKGLMFAVDASAGSVAEALSVPFQQIARLYNEKGEEAFTEEELELLYAAIDSDMIGLYDPIIADRIKTAFWYHIDTIMENKKAYVSLWIRKGLQYPGIYIASFLDNTYQMWYPGTYLKDLENYRYFDITGWQTEYGRPKINWLYDLYACFNHVESYNNYPVFRMFFSTGVMLWTCLIAFFYGIWKRSKAIVYPLLLVLLVCATSMCGPVSDIRYYLILFYLFPVSIAFLGERIKNEG